MSEPASVLVEPATVAPLVDVTVVPSPGDPMTSGTLGGAVTGTSVGVDPMASSAVGSAEGGASVEGDATALSPGLGLAVGVDEARAAGEDASSG